MPSRTVPTTQIVILDQPGFQTGGPTTTGFMMLTGAVPLVSAHIQNALDEFTINFADELVSHISFGINLTMLLKAFSWCITDDGGDLSVVQQCRLPPANGPPPNLTLMSDDDTTPSDDDMWTTHSQCHLKVMTGKHHLGSDDVHHSS